MLHFIMRLNVLKLMCFKKHFEKLFEHFFLIHKFDNRN